MSTLNQELHELRRLKDEAERLGREKEKADTAFKKQKAKCLQRAEIEEADSSRTRGYLYTFEQQRVKGQVEDRGPYVRWALENDPVVQEFLSFLAAISEEDLEDRFYEAITSTSTVKYKEDGHVMNQQARSHIDDAAPLPPGLTFRPDPTISMRKS